MSVEDLAQLVAGGEAPVDQLQELLAEVGLHGEAEGRVEPEDPASARPFVPAASVRRDVRQVLAVPGPVEGVLEGGLGEGGWTCILIYLCLYTCIYIFIL